MKNYTNAPLDFYGKLVTVIFGVSTFVIVFISIFYEIGQLYPIASLFALISLVSVAFIPKIYIENKVLTIKNLFSKTVIPLSEIDKVAVGEDNSGYRTFGIGGVFGYYGTFNGNEKWFVTNRKFLVKIKTKAGKIYAVSPKERSKFLTDINYQNIKLN